VVTGIYVPATPPNEIPRGVLRDLVNGLSNQTKTIWDGEPEPFLASQNGKGGCYFKLDITSYTSLGVDEYRQTIMSPGLVNSSSLNGVRSFVMNITAISFDFARNPMDMLESLRLRFRSVSARAIMEAEGIALVGFLSPIVPVKFVMDNRAVSMAILDVKLSRASVEDAGDDTGGTIATAQVSGTAS
jgi:hypothetical protein